MKPTTYDDALVSIYSMLVERSGLPKNLVINGNSISGADVEKIITQTKRKSPKVTDVFMTFEFREIQSEDFGASPDGATSMDVIAPYGLFLKIYGEHSHDLAQRMLATFKYPQVAMYLDDNGIRITNVGAIESVNEFINYTRWERCDLEVDMLCWLTYDFEQNSNYDTVAETFVKPLHIINF